MNELSAVSQAGSEGYGDGTDVVAPSAGAWIEISWGGGGKPPPYGSFHKRETMEQNHVAR